METIATLERRKIEIANLISEENTRHTKTIDELNSERSVAQSQSRMICCGIDTNIVLLAEHVIRVSGKFSAAGTDKSLVLNKAISMILDGGNGLMREYIGTKSYDRWHGQYITCPYGMGPSHGHVIFRIELTAEVRKRNAVNPLTEEEINAAVYYLRNLTAIQDCAS